MRFEIKGKEYFLAFVEDEKKWFVFSPSNEGLQRLPVYIDVKSYDRGNGFEKTAGNAQN